MNQKAFKKLCIDLRKQDYSLPEIVRVTGRSKTTIYFHIKDIPLSPAKQEAIRRASAVRIIAARKAAPYPYKPFLHFEQWDEWLVSLVAHLSFDGEIRSRAGACAYHNRRDALINHVRTCFQKIYTHEPRFYTKGDGVKTIVYGNAALARYIAEKRSELFSNILSFPPELRLVFLKAFFDDEDCISFESKKNRRRVRGYQHNPQILQLVQMLLKKFGIDSRISGSVEICIGGRNNIERFAQEINFSPGVTVNGERSNSIWKEHLEKREILRRALASYQTQSRVR